MSPKGAQVLVTSALSAPGEGHSRVGRKNLPRIRPSEITATLHSLRLTTNRLKMRLSHGGPRGPGQHDVSLRSNCGAIRSPVCRVCCLPHSVTPEVSDDEAALLHQ
jgi:hypothetical protein